MNPVKQAIKTYLDNRAKTDELFAVAYAKPNKNIDECFNYVVGEARKQGGNAVYVSDEASKPLRSYKVVECATRTQTNTMRL